MPSMQSENKCKVLYIIKRPRMKISHCSKDCKWICLLINEMTIIRCEVFFSFTAELEKLSLGGQKYKRILEK